MPMLAVEPTDYDPRLQCQPKKYYQCREDAMIAMRSARRH